MYLFGFSLTLSGLWAAVSLMNVCRACSRLCVCVFVCVCPSAR